jgi:hypothetical protein
MFLSPGSKATRRRRVALPLLGAGPVAVDVNGNVLVGGPAFGYQDGIINGTLSASIASNNLTVALKTFAGNNPSPSDPVLIVFRSNGSPLANSFIPVITSPVSFTVNSGNTLGTAANVPFRLWVVAFQDAGTIRLGLINCITGGATVQIFPLVEGNVFVSSTGGNGGNSAGVIYTGVGVSTLPYKILGYFEWNLGLPTAGAWSSGPGFGVLFTPGVKKPGDIVQTVYASASATVNFTTTSFVNGGISALITPTSSANPVRARVTGTGFINVNGTGGILALNRGSTPIGFAITWANASQSQATMTIEALDAPGTAGQTVYQTSGRVGVISGSPTFQWPIIGFGIAGPGAFLCLDEMMA